MSTTLDAGRQHFSRQQYMLDLGAELTRFERGHSQVELPYRPSLGQQHGYFHGGVIGALADTAAGFAVYSTAEPGRDVLTVEYKVNFLAPARGELLVARGTVLRTGRTLGSASANVYTVREGTEELVATLLTTLRFIDVEAQE